MNLNILRLKQADDCAIHGKGSRAANRTLLSLVVAAAGLIVWHVWRFGPTGGAGSDALRESFPSALGTELWDLLVGPHGVLEELWAILPYFVIGLLLAGLIRTYKLAVRLRRHLVRHGFSSVLLASLIGVITPLCACGILTTAISLLFAGVPMAPVMALLVSSPLISPTTYLLTLSDLGPQWTVVRTLAAFLMGLFAGVVTHLLRKRGFETEELFIEGAVPRGDFHDEQYPREDLRCNCKQQFGNRVAVRTTSTVLVFLAKSAEMAWPVGKYILVGIAFGAIIERYIPSDWLFRLFGSDDPLNIVWITLGAIPIFLHQVSASSILHHIKGGLDGTLNSGAGLAFLIGGPVTAIPTMTMLWALFRKRLFFLYLAICLVGTIGLAYAFQYLVFVPNVDTDNPLLRGVTSIAGGKSSAIIKSDRNVRVVMNPGGKNMIAVYTNEVDGSGPVVFDAGRGRVAGQAAERFDNSRYVRNIAGFLEENSSSVERKSILVYDMAGGQEGDRFSEALIQALEQHDGSGPDARTPESVQPVLDRFRISGCRAARGSGTRCDLWVLFRRRRAAGRRYRGPCRRDGAGGCEPDCVPVRRCLFRHGRNPG